MFHGLTQSPETHVSPNVIVSTIGPPRRWPLKDCAVSIEEVPGLQPKEHSPLAHQPHRSAACDL